MVKSNKKRNLAIFLWLALGAVLLFFAALSAFFLGDAVVALVRMMAQRTEYAGSSWSVEMAVTLLVALSVSLFSAVGGDALIAFKLKALFKSKEEAEVVKPDRKQVFGGALLVLSTCALLIALVASTYGISSGSVSLAHRFEGAPWVSRVIAETIVSAVFFVIAGAGTVLCALWWKGVFKQRNGEPKGLQTLAQTQKMNLALYGVLMVFFVFLLGFVLWLFA